MMSTFPFTGEAVARAPSALPGMAWAIWAVPVVLVGLLVVLVPAELAAQACEGTDCVFFHRGTLVPGASKSDDGTWAKELELTDLDGDGWLDLILARKQPLFEETNGSLSIVPGPHLDAVYANLAPAGLNLGLDKVQSIFDLDDKALPTGYSSTRGYDLEVADINGDGDVDILRIDTPGLFSVLLGQGDGTFTLEEGFDLLGGGDPNLGCEVTFVKDDGDSSTSCDPADPDGLDINCGGNYDDVDLADVDHDGKMDFLISQWAACGENVLVRNLGASIPGGAPAFQRVSLPSLEANVTHSVALGDVNGDCKVDILLGHARDAANNEVPPHLLLGQSTSSFSFPSTPSFIFSEIMNDDFGAITVADIVGDPVSCDFDGDGIPDDDGIPDNLPDLTGDDLADVFLAKDGFNGDAPLGLYINDDDVAAPYTEATFCTGDCSDANRYDVRYGDFDSDGAMEAVVVSFNVNECTRNSTNCDRGTSCVKGTDIVVYRFSATGFEEVTDEFTAITAQGDINKGGISIASGDLDQDGDLDIVLGGVKEGSAAQVRDVLSPCRATNDTEVFGAAHVYENLTRTRLANRNVVSGAATLLGHQELVAENASVTGLAQLTLESKNTIVLRTGFSATPSGSGKLIARIVP